MLLSIVTLNYKKPNLTLACIASLFDQFKNKFEDGTIELIIVDNNSADDSVALLREAIKKHSYKNVTLIANKENGGFSKGCNLGASGAKGKYVVFLNNDTISKDTGILAMAEYLEKHAEIGILGGQLRNTDGSRQPSTGKFYTLGNAILFLLGLQKYGLVDKNPNEIRQVDWVKGALFMLRLEVFKSLGGFDENIFMYTEDMEFCYRAKLEGYTVFFYPETSVFHKEQGSANRSFAIIHIYKGLLYFYKKHKSPLEYGIIKMLLQMKAWAAISIGTMTRNAYLVTTYRQAIQSLL